VSGRREEGDRGESAAPWRRAGRSLVQRAADELKAAPLPAGELARRVMGLSGPEDATAMTLQALLGPDPRFRVSADGIWSLETAFLRVGPSLGILDYAVVDVETTGGDPATGDRIIEVAVIEIRDGMISREYRSLVNPRRRIPPRIIELTGITDAAVAEAPPFDEVADEVAARLGGRVFVAQNASFDRKFLAAQMEESIGAIPPAEVLCTVRMARRLVPELRKRNLDALSRHFGIQIHGRHRAYGDALATARIFLRLMDEASTRGIRDLHQLVTYLGGDLGSDRSDPAPDPDAEEGQVLRIPPPPRPRGRRK